MKKLVRIALVVAALLIVLGGLAWIKRDWLIAKTYLATLESDFRVQSLQIDRVIDALEIEPGQRIADVGAGTGLFSLPLAEAAGDGGIVYAVDVNAELLEHIDETVDGSGVANVRTVLADESDPKLPEPVDLVFICDTFHHIDDRDAYLLTLRRYLRPGGRIAIIDFRESSPHIDAVIVPSMRYTFAELEAWMAAAGYERTHTHDFLSGNFFVVYGCIGCPEPASARDSGSAR